MTEGPGSEDGDGDLVISTLLSLTATVETFRQELEMCVSRVAALEVELYRRTDPRNWA